MYTCPLTATYVSSSYCVPVWQGASRLLYYMSPYCYISLPILLHMCPHTATYVCPYSYICVLIRLHVCPHTATYVSPYSYICVVILLCACVAGCFSPSVLHVPILLHMSYYYIYRAPLCVAYGCNTSVYPAICVLILLILVSSYYCILIRRCLWVQCIGVSCYMCPHTTMLYVS